MNSSEAATLAEQIMRFQKEDPDKAARAFGTNIHLLFPSLCKVLQREQILDAVEQVLGRNLLLWSASFLLRDPRRVLSSHGIRIVPIGGLNRLRL